MRRTVIIDAPSNLGLRPPAPGEVPGCHGLAAALRARDLPRRIGAHDGGAVPAPAYDRGDWRLGDGVFHAPQLATYTRRLAERIGTFLDAGDFPVVLGGDCAIQLGASLALRRRGRYGLLAADASADFRHLGNAPAVGAAAGEEVAIATGRGQADLADIDGLRPYLREEDIRYAGIRDGDEDIPELASLGDGRRHGRRAARAGPRCGRRGARGGAGRRGTGRVLGCTATRTYSTPPSCPPWTAPTRADWNRTNSRSCSAPCSRTRAASA